VPCPRSLTETETEKAAKFERAVDPWREREREKVRRIGKKQNSKKEMKEKRAMKEKGVI
jgi:hypothetical protein